MHPATPPTLQRATIWGLLHVFVRAVGNSQHGQAIGASSETHNYPGRNCKWEVEVSHPSSANYHFGSSTIGWRLQFGHGKNLEVFNFETEGFEVEEWSWQSQGLGPTQETPEEFSETLRRALRRYLAFYRVSLDPDAQAIFGPN